MAGVDLVTTLIRLADLITELKQDLIWATYADNIEETNEDD
jgi:hypothetical protein